MRQNKSSLPLLFGLVYVEETVDAHKIIHLLSYIFYPPSQLVYGHMSSSGQEHVMRSN